jgi:hypothetical protein
MADEPSDNARSAFDYFVGQGLSPVQAAGIVGNLQGESGQGLNPGSVNRGDGRDGSDSIGIGQWNSTRAQGLKDYAASKGVPWNDLTTQLEYLHSELKGPESSAYKGLLAAQTPEEAGRAMLAYERPKDWNVPGAHPERGQYAARVFAAYGGGGAPASPAAPLSAPLSLAPPQTPIFAQQPQQPQGGQAAGGGIPQFAPPPLMALPQAPVPLQMAQAAPIFYAQRRSPDLSKLRAAFSRG